MKKNKEKTNKLKMSKGEVAVRIMGVFLAILMVISVCAPCIYYAMEFLGQ